MNKVKERYLFIFSNAAIILYTIFFLFTDVENGGYAIVLGTLFSFYAIIREKNIFQRSNRFIVSYMAICFILSIVLYFVFKSVLLERGYIIIPYVVILASIIYIVIGLIDRSAENLKV